MLDGNAFLAAGRRARRTLFVLLFIFISVKNCDNFNCTIC